MTTWKATAHQRWVAVLEDPTANTGLPSRDARAADVRAYERRAIRRQSSTTAPWLPIKNEHLGDCGAYRLR
jgi:hypothetical protein